MNPTGQDGKWVSNKKAVNMNQTVKINNKRYFFTIPSPKLVE